MEERILKAFDGTEIHWTLWNDCAEPKGVVQILHGVAEHIARYDEFARFLNANGFIAAGDDHRCHGRTSGANALGITDGRTFDQTVKDAFEISEELIEEYRLPLFIFGHSYGSFLAQEYLQRPNRAAGFILSGSAHMGGILVISGLQLAKLICLFHGKDSRAGLLQQMTVGKNDKFFEDEGHNAWLSRDPGVRAAYNADPYCGFTNTNGFYREMLRGLRGLYKKKRLAAISKDTKIFIFSGADDPVGGQGKLTTKLYEMYRGLKLAPEFKLYEKARHEMLNENNKEEVFADVLRFLDSCISAD